MIITLFVLFRLIPMISSAENLAPADLQGEWLNKEYYERLIVTKSPREAVQGIYYTSFSIIPEQDNYEWIQIFNFHEGLRFNVTGLQPETESNIYRIVFHEKQRAGHATRNDRFHIPSGKPINEIDWIFAPLYDKTTEKQRITFIRAEPDIQRLVNNTVLAGTYSDEKGKSFVFGENVIAQWPDTTFTYIVALDYVYKEPDNFYIIDERKGNIATVWYAFEWQENKLYIYTTHPHEVVKEKIYRDEKPLFVLTPK